MKKICFFVVLLLGISTQAQNLTPSNYLDLTRKYTLNSITSFLQQRGYQLQDKKQGNKGYPGYDVTDYAYGYNAIYNPYTDIWEFHNSSVYSYVRILWNNQTNAIETMFITTNAVSQLNTYRNLLPQWGYQLWQTDTEIFANGIAYKYFNNSLETNIWLEENSNGFITIHFWKDKY